MKDILLKILNLVLDLEVACIKMYPIGIFTSQCHYHILINKTYWLYNLLVCHLSYWHELSINLSLTVILCFIPEFYFFYFL